MKELIDAGSDSNRNDGIFPAARRCDTERPSLSVSESATIIALRLAVKEPGPLKQNISIASRMAIVLAFLFGMPLVAVPQVSEHLQGLLGTRPRTQAADHQPSDLEAEQPIFERESPELGTTVTVLASERPQPPPIRADHVTMAATIEALKLQFVEAGVSYMVLEQIGAESVKYRFLCDLPVTEGSAYRERFQVVSDAPDEAMRQALAELQQWRIASREPGYLERPTVILR